MSGEEQEVIEGEAGYDLSDNQIEFIESALQQDFEVGYSYSGRGMYGKQCPSVDVDGIGEFGTKAKTSHDNMGKGFIIYCPD